MKYKKIMTDRKNRDYKTSNQKQKSGNLGRIEIFLQYEAMIIWNVIPVNLNSEKIYNFLKFFIKS